MANQPRSALADREQALFDPASVFASPEEVLACAEFTDAQKIEVLRRWEYDASEIAVAEEEGMLGPEDDTLERIVLALDRLTGSVDVEHTGPTKHRSLPRLSRPRTEEKDCN